MKTAYEQGLEWQSCDPALELRKAYPSQKAWFEEGCPHGEWGFWNLQHLPDDKLRLLLPTLILLANKIADRAVRKYAVGSNIDAWAKDWLSGKDRTMASAASAARASAARASAAWAEWEAWAEWASAESAVRASAESAVRASAESAEWARAASAVRASAAWAAESKLQMDEIRELIPVWPGGEGCQG